MSYLFEPEKCHEGCICVHLVVLETEAVTHFKTLPLKLGVTKDDCPLTICRDVEEVMTEGLGEVVDGWGCIDEVGDSGEGQWLKPLGELLVIVHLYRVQS